MTFPSLARNPPALVADRAVVASRATWPLYAVLFASASVVLGVIWDISWHRTIGRDTFWTPAHLAIYLGGVVAGLTCGWLALHTTFGGSAEDRAVFCDVFCDAPRDPTDSLQESSFRKNRMQP